MSGCEKHRDRYTLGDGSCLICTEAVVLSKIAEFRAGALRKIDVLTAELEAMTSRYIRSAADIASMDEELSLATEIIFDLAERRLILRGDDGEFCGYQADWGDRFEEMIDRFTHVATKNDKDNL